MKLSPEKYGRKTLTGLDNDWINDCSSCRTTQQDILAREDLMNIHWSYIYRKYLK